MMALKAKLQDNHLKQRTAYLQVGTTMLNNNLGNLRYDRNLIKVWSELSLVVLYATLASSLPVKLVADFPSFALAMLGGPTTDLEQLPSLLVTSSSSSPYQYRNSGSFDDDSDDLVDTAFVSIPKVAPNSDYAEQIDTLLTATTNNSNEIITGDSSTIAKPTDLQQKQKVNSSSSSTLSRFIISGRKSNIIRLPNGQSFHICDENNELKCDDENAVCELGACVCRDGFFANRQSGLCQSISDMLKNCENDLHCQAFNVDLVCDTKSHERPFCDCTDGLYFDQETHNCLPCHRNTWLVHTSNMKEADQVMWLANMSIESLAPVSLNVNTSARVNNSQQEQQQQPLSAPISLSSSTTPAPMLTTSPTATAKSAQLRPCKPIDLVRLSSRRRQQLSASGLPHYTSNFEQPFRGSSLLSTSATATSHLAASSDPFRIKVPLEVFTGAIILFTLFTVAWFLLQRIIHDCRFKILRSLHNPDFTGASYPELQSSFAHPNNLGFGLNSTSSIARARSTNHLYFDPTSQTVARLFTATDHSGNSSGGGTYSAHSPFTGLYQRDLAGIMVQHLAANLSPSSTSQTLVGPNGSAATRNLLAGQSDHEVALYPLTASAQQSRTAAAAAAAQLLLSPTHPAIAILRAAAAQSPGNDYSSANLLCAMFDPPPKYEEAIAQSTAQQLNVVPQYSPQTPPLVGDQDQSNSPNNLETIEFGVDSGNEQDVRQHETEQVEDDTTAIRSNDTNASNILDPSRDGTSLPVADSVGSLLNVCVTPIEEQLHSDDLLQVASSPIKNTNQSPNADQRSDSSSAGLNQREILSSNNMETSNQQRRQNSSAKRVSRRSRRGRGSLSWSQQQHQKQQQAQDSDDTLEE